MVAITADGVSVGAGVVFGVGLGVCVGVGTRMDGRCARRGCVDCVVVFLGFESPVQSSLLPF